MSAEIDDAPEPGQHRLIRLRSVKPRYRPGQCAHTNFELDEELAEVRCLDCGEKLNPIRVLSKLAREESLLGMRRAALAREKAALERRRTCQCEHCGQKTRIKR